ncbi:MAG: hypothetical protein ACR2OA_21830, partial [Rubripirellula sp.]
TQLQLHPVTQHQPHPVTQRRAARLPPLLEIVLVGLFQSARVNFVLSEMCQTSMPAAAAVRAVLVS